MSSYKHYGLRQYLKSDETLKYIEALTGAQLNNFELTRLIIEERLPVYVLLVHCGEGWLRVAGFDEHSVVPWREDSGYGLARVVDDLDSIRGENQLGLGFIFTPSEHRPLSIENKKPQRVDVAVLTGATNVVVAAVFLVKDIQRLADQINTADSKPLGINEPEQPRPIKKTAHQASLIIEALEERGLDPQRLPAPNGKAGIKKEIREQLDNKYPFEASSAFDTAWKLHTKPEKQ